MSDTGSDGRCVNGTALRSVGDVGVSPDGGSAYALAGGIALTSYGRDRDTGELAPRACVLGTTLASSGCAIAPPLAGVRDLIVAPDGQVIVADGTPEAAERIRRTLLADPGMGVIRHADAGYDEALEAADRLGVRIPMAP